MGRGWAACPVIQEMCGIVKIWRFRDEVLVLASERLKSHTDGRSMINREGYFTTKCKKIRNDKIEYLHCEVSIGNGTIQSRPFFENQPIWEFVYKTQAAILHTFTSRGPSLWFDAVETSARRTATQRKQRRFLSRGLSGTWPHQASSAGYEKRVQAKQKHREAQNDEVETGCG